ncbi:MAG: hypothetical protein KC619_15415 [Myxococcales bacterium]|nr:hypothetical protein [Myxococcales bacterium]
MRARRKSMTVPGVSQFNWHTGASNTWCGRAAGSMLYNYYVRAYGGSPSDYIVNNRDDSSHPYDIIFPDGTQAALILTGQYAGSFSPTKPVVERHPAGIGDRFGVAARPLYPKKDRPAGVPTGAQIDTILAPLLDYLDHNNPALFGSGLSKGKTGHASHFILVTGYKYDDGGALWLEITDPSINHPIITGIFPNEQLVEVIDAGVFVPAPCSSEPTETPTASRYWVKAELFFRPNPHLAGKGNWQQKYGSPPDPMLFCDNDQNFSQEDGFAVLLADPVPDTPAGEWVTTELGTRMPVSADVTGDWVTVADPQAPFPIGGNRTWHSGVRVLGPAAPAGEGGADAGASPAAGDKKVWSIAEGTLAAVRFPEEPLEEGAVSNGMLLVRHELEPNSGTLLPPVAQDGDEPDTLASAREEALPFYVLYLHLAPISTLLDEAGDPTNALTPPWLRKLGPTKPPDPIVRVPIDTPLRLSTWSDAELGESVALPMLHLTKTPELLWDAATSQLAGVETVQMKLGGDDRLVVPVLQGATQRDAFAGLFGPKVEVGHDRLLYNPLTGDVIEAPYSRGRVAAGVPLRTREAAPTLVGRLGEIVGKDAEVVQELDVLHEDGDDCYVALADQDAHPGFVVAELPSARSWSRTEAALSFDEGVEVTLKAEVGSGFRNAVTLSGPDHLMRFSGTGVTSGTDLPDEVPADLLACVALTPDEVAGAPTTVPGTRKLHYYNELTHEVIETELDVDAEVGFVMHEASPAVVAQVGDTRYARVQGYRAVLDTARVDGVVGNVLRFDASVTKVRLYSAMSYGKEGDPTTRKFPDGSRLDLKSSEFLLTFEIEEEANTFGKDRIWPRLVSVTRMSKSDVKRIDKALKEQDALLEVVDRLAASHSSLYAVELGEDHGWQLSEEGKIVPLEPAEGAEEVERHFCAVSVNEGVLTPVRVEGDTSEHPLQLQPSPDVSIHPVHVVAREGTPAVAFFEVIESVAADAPHDNGDEIKKHEDENKERKAFLEELATGTLKVFEPEERPRLGAEWIGSMGPTGAGDGVHVELFSGKNLIDDTVTGRDDEMVPVPNTTWAVLRDDQPEGQFTSGFVKKMFDQVVGSPLFAFDRSHLPEDAVESDPDGEPTEDEWVPSTPEWIDFCNHGTHPRQLARLISCHALYWQSSTKDLLDHADARAAHLNEDTRQGIKDAIDALAWGDDVPLDETASSSLDPSVPIFHYHPLRFVEWLSTGVDIDASLYGEEGAADRRVTIDIGTSTGLPIDPVPGHGGLFRFRTTVGDVNPQLAATLHLEGFGTTANTLRVVVERGKVTAIQLTRPRVSVSADLSTRAPKLATPVSVRDRGDLVLLADNGLATGSGLDHVLVEGTTYYNVVAPERVEVTLADSSGFRFVDVGQSTTGYDVAVAADSVVFTRRADHPVSPAPGPRTGRFLVGVAAKDRVGAASAVTFAASGGDLPGTYRASTPQLTTRELYRDKSIRSNDVTKLQVLLSQIPAKDGLPCYRYGGQRDYGNRGVKQVIADGDYGKSLAGALWRFIDTYEADTEQYWSATVRYLKDEDRSEASLAPASIRDDANLAARVEGTRKDYPIVDQPLLTEIVSRFNGTYVNPVPAVDFSLELDHLMTSVFAVKADQSNLKTVLSRTAILPLDDEVVQGTLRLTGVLDDTYDVTLRLVPKSHYRLGCELESTLTVTRGRPYASFSLYWCGNDTEQDVSPLEELDVCAPDGTVLTTISLAGVRDLETLQSVPGRDVYLLETYLSQIRDPASPKLEPCFRHRNRGKGAVRIDGVHTVELTEALQRFMASLDASPGTYTELVTEIRDAYLDAIAPPMSCAAEE